MTTLTPTLPEIIDKLEKRVTSLEISGTLPKNLVGPTLTIANLTTQISQYVEATTGQMRGRVLLDWDDIVSPSTDLLTVDPFDHYEIAYLLPTETAQTQVSSDQSAAVFNNLPLDVNITFKVRAVTVSNVKGPWTGTTINTSHDTTPPVQPSTPTVTAALKSVIVSWDGKDSTNAAMASDFAYCEVHVSKVGATFTPSTATYVNRLYKGGGVINVLSDDTYATLYVRLVAYDTSGNASVVSTAGSATPIKAVSTDLDVALLGDITYRDEGNLLIDGSFESSAVRLTRETSGTKVGTWTFDNTSGFAAFGAYCLKIVGDATPSKYFYLNGYQELLEAPAIAGTKLYVAARIRGVSATGTASIAIRFRSQTNVITSTTAISTATSTGSYVLLEGVVDIPADCKSIVVSAQTDTQTTGTWYFDAIQVRSVIGTLLIQDAAITTAKIANLAVNDAKIADLSAAKITTGQLQAGTEIIAGSTSTSHARLTGTGLRVFGPDTTGDGIPDEVIRLGTTSDDYFGIVNGAGTLISSIDNTGKGTFTGLSVTGDPTIQGELLSVKLDRAPKGIIEWRQNMSATYQACTTPVGLGQMTAYTVPGRRYRVTVHGPRGYSDVAGTTILMTLYYRWGTGAISLTTYSSNICNTVLSCNGVTYESIPELSWVFSGGGYIRFMPVVQRLTGTGNCTVFWDSGCYLEMSLEDLGLPDRGTWEPNNGGGSGAPTTMQYTSIWQSASSASYKGDNTQRSTSSVYQYYYPGTSWGDQKGAWYFPNNAISGETDKTMAAALAGAVSIDGVWIYANAEHWYWNDGGIAKIYAHGSTSNSGSRPATWDYLASSGGGAEGRWPKPGARWVYVGNSANWKNLYRGFGIGPAGVADNTYYGYFTGGTGAQIQVRYTR